MTIPELEEQLRQPDAQIKEQAARSFFLRSVTSTDAHKHFPLEIPVAPTSARYDRRVASQKTFV